MAKRASERTAPSGEQPAPLNANQSSSLRQEVKQALLMVLRDSAASAAAKSSAGRTLLEYYDDESTALNVKRRGADMSASELDQAIADLER